MDQPAPVVVSASVPLHDWPVLLGLKRGQNVLLAADLTRIAWMHRRSGAQQVPALVLGAFVDHLGSEGTLVLPTFNHDLRDGELYDPASTSPISGTLSVAALANPAFKRTCHPLHSFAVAGRLQQRFGAIDEQSSFSAASPFGLFRSEGFVVVGIDMDLDYAFSYFHHVEELEQVPYRVWHDYSIRYKRGASTTPRSFKIYRKRWGYANRLRDLKPLLSEGGAMHTTQVDGSTVLSVDIRRAHDIIERDIRLNGARSIVHFTWKSWLRDLVHAVLPQRPSRSAMQFAPTDARPH